MPPNSREVRLQLRPPASAPFRKQLHRHSADFMQVKSCSTKPSQTLPMTTYSLITTTITMSRAPVAGMTTITVTPFCRWRKR